MSDVVMINPMIKNTVVDPALVHYQAEYTHHHKNFSGHELTWLQQLRAQALQQFTQTGFPTFHDEEWKYTNVAPIAKRAFKCVTAPTDFTAVQKILAGLIPSTLNCHRMVFLDGHFMPQLSQLDDLPAGVTLTGLAQQLCQQPAVLQPYLGQTADTKISAFTALNTAFMQDGAYIHIAANTVLTQPIYLLFLTSGQTDLTFIPVRNLIVAEENSVVTVIEDYQNITAGTHSHFTNVVTELTLGKHAVVEHYKLLQENDTAFHIGTLNINQQSHSRLTSHSFAFGGLLTRSDIQVLFAAEHAECTLNGLYLAQGKQHIDHHTFIDHAHPHGTSREFYKGVLGDRARAVFNGKVMVRPNSYKSDAKQTNKNLLLSAEAEIDTKPQLEIYNDDVKCTHGATVGQLNDQALFYLRSRGLDNSTARRILIYAFVREILERVPLLPLRQQLEQKIKHLGY